MKLNHFSTLALAGFILLGCLSLAGQALLAPQSGVAAPPVLVQGDTRMLDPTWVGNRGQVILVLYVGKNSQVPEETILRVNDWQERYAPMGLQVVIIAEDQASVPPGLDPKLAVMFDSKGKTRERYQITGDREYFVVDRYGRLQRQKINETLIRNFLNESFDPTWVGYSGAWNQTFFVHRNEFLFYIADTLPDTVKAGQPFDLRLVALPTFTSPRPGSRIHAPIQVEVTSESPMEKEVYRAELNEEVEVSTEMLLQISFSKNVEKGLHILWVDVHHGHCGFGNCGNFKQTLPVPVWVE